MDIVFALAYDTDDTILCLADEQDTCFAGLDAKAVRITLCLAGLPDPPDGRRFTVKVDVAAGTVQIG